jgi:hypothetical protein
MRIDQGRARLGRQGLLAACPDLAPVHPRRGIVYPHRIRKSQISQATVSKYVVRHRKPPSQTWRTENHLRSLVSVDFFIVPTVTFKACSSSSSWCTSGDAWSIAT